MRKEIIKKGYFVQITFNKKSIVQISSNVFWSIPETIENKYNLPNKQFESWAFSEMKKKYISRKNRSKKWIEKRKEIFIKYWINH